MRRKEQSKTENRISGLLSLLRPKMADIIRPGGSGQPEFLPFYRTRSPSQGDSDSFPSGKLFCQAGDWEKRHAPSEMSLSRRQTDGDPKIAGISRETTFDIDAGKASDSEPRWPPRTVSRKNTAETWNSAISRATTIADENTWQKEGPKAI